MYLNKQCQKKTVCNHDKNRKYYEQNISFYNSTFCSDFHVLPVRKEKQQQKDRNEIELIAEKQLVFPLDEQTYYLSKSMFQFEENGKEYLHFENTQKSLYDIVIFDIENQQIAKRIPLHKTGPNGLPAVYGSRPSPDSKYILIAQNDISRLSSINDKGEVIRNYDFQTPEGKFAPLHFGSYYNTPAFVKDSCLFMEMSAHKPQHEEKRLVRDTYVRLTGFENRRN